MTGTWVHKPVAWPLWSTMAALLLLPLIAMQFTRDVAWTGSDFLAAALLLGTGGLFYELVVRAVRRPARRAMAIAMVGPAVLTIWAQGAVGIV